jgi:hypothetical protein
MACPLPSARPCVRCRRVCLAARWTLTPPLADATPWAGMGQARRVFPGEDGSCRYGAWWREVGDLDREPGVWLHPSQARLWLYRYAKGGSKRDRHVREPGEAALRKHPVPGTIRGAVDGALDGVQARLMRRTTGGYPVALCASHGACHRWDRVDLSGTEGAITRRAMHHDSPAICLQCYLSTLTTFVYGASRV